MLVAVSADTQERWRRFYEETATQKDRDFAGDLIQKAESRAFWQHVFMFGSVVFLGGLMTFFYSVLSQTR
jgi:hypothetical protein